MNTDTPKMYIRKCPGCGGEVDKRIGIHVSTRYWHEKCYEKKVQEDRIIQEKHLKKQAIQNYLYQIGSKATPVIITRKRNELVKEYGYDDTGILLALKYWYGVKQNPFDKDKGIGLGIVPFIYDEAQAYYKKKIELYTKIKKNIENNQDKQITIKVPKSKPIDKGLIDINTLKESGK